MNDPMNRKFKKDSKSSRKTRKRDLQLVYGADKSAHPKKAQPADCRKKAR